MPHGKCPRFSARGSVRISQGSGPGQGRKLHVRPQVQFAGFSHIFGQATKVLGGEKPGRGKHLDERWEPDS